MTITEHIKPRTYLNYRKLREGFLIVYQIKNYYFLFLFSWIEFLIEATLPVHSPFKCILHNHHLLASLYIYSRRNSFLVVALMILHFSWTKHNLIFITVLNILDLLNMDIDWPCNYIRWMFEAFSVRTLKQKLKSSLDPLL